MLITCRWMHFAPAVAVIATWHQASAKREPAKSHMPKLSDSCTCCQSCGMVWVVTDAMRHTRASHKLQLHAAQTFTTSASISDIILLNPADSEVLKPSNSTACK
jgi:hypothetical protein